MSTAIAGQIDVEAALRRHLARIQCGSAAPPAVRKCPAFSGACCSGALCVWSPSLFEQLLVGGADFRIVGGKGVGSPQLFDTRIVIPTVIENPAQPEVGE